MGFLNLLIAREEISSWSILTFAIDRLNVVTSVFAQKCICDFFLGNRIGIWEFARN